MIARFKNSAAWTIGFLAFAALLHDPQARAEDEASPRSVFVVNTQDASISLVDLETMQETRRIAVGNTPYGIAVTADGAAVAVGVEGEEKVKFLDTSDFSLRGEVPIGKMHNDHIILSEDGSQILVANFYSDDVVAIDVAQMKEVARIEGCSAPKSSSTGRCANGHLSPARRLRASPSLILPATNC